MGKVQAETTEEPPFITNGDNESKGIDLGKDDGDMPLLMQVHVFRGWGWRWG